MMYLSKVIKASIVIVGLTSSMLSGATHASIIDLPGLIHLWSGEGNANDSVGTSNGTLGANTTFETGYLGQAFSFDGSQGAVSSFPVNINPNVLPQMTVGMYVNVDSIANNRGWIFGHDNGGYDRALMVSDTRFGGGLAATAGSNGPYTASLLNFSTNLDQWFGIAVSYDQTNNTGVLYVNDLQGSSMTQTFNTSISNGYSEFTLGGLNRWANHTVDAQVDELFISNQALTKSQLDQAFDVPEPSLIGLLGLTLMALFRVKRR